MNNTSRKVNDKMSITAKRLKELERAEAMLQALEAGGVDDWDNYDDSLVEYRAAYELEEKRELLLDKLELVFGMCAFEPSERGAGIAFTDDVQSQAMSILKEMDVYFKE